MNYPNYIFDLYGTLADIWTNEESPVLWRRAALWYREHGAPWQARPLQRRYLELCGLEQSRFSDPLAEIELRRVFAALFAEQGVRSDAALVEDTARFFRISSIKKLKLYPWVLPAFERLRAEGSRLYLLSNAQACFTEGELLGLGLSDAFDGVLLSSDAGVKKPSAKILGLLMERWHLSPEDCLLVGNDPDADIAMASAAGMDTLYLKTATSPQDRLPPVCTRMLLNEDYGRMDELLRMPERADEQVK